MSLLLIVSLIALCFSVICMLLVFMLFQRNKASTELSKTHKLRITELENKTTNLSNEIHEIRSGNYGVINKVKELVQQIEQLQSTQQTLAEQDPQVRFYSKATKLISQGASLEDVIKECDIPSAEAELLFSLHTNKK